MTSRTTSIVLSGHTTPRRVNIKVLEQPHEQSPPKMQAYDTAITPLSLSLSTRRPVPFLCDQFFNMTSPSIFMCCDNPILANAQHRLTINSYIFRSGILKFTLNPSPISLLVLVKLANYRYESLAGISNVIAAAAASDSETGA